MHSNVYNRFMPIFRYWWEFSPWFSWDLRDGEEFKVLSVWSMLKWLPFLFREFDVWTDLVQMLDNFFALICTCDFKVGVPSLKPHPFYTLQVANFLFFNFLKKKIWLTWYWFLVVSWHLICLELCRYIIWFMVPCHDS